MSPPPRDASTTAQAREAPAPHDFRGDRRGLLSALIVEGVVTRADLVSHDIELFDSDRRNDNTIVTVDGVPTWFVKRPQAGAPAHLVLQEQQLLATLAHQPGLPVPRLRAAGGHGMCVTDFISDSETVAARVQRLGRVNQTIARGIGRGLARIHALDDVPLPEDAIFHPWALSLDAPLADMLSEASQGTLSFLHHVQTPDLTDALTRLRHAWQPVALTHNDVKFDNILVGTAAPHRMVLTDWETGHRGDPAWDVGSVIAEFLNLWLSSMTASDTMSIGEIQASATRPLKSILPSIATFIAAYRRAREVDAEFVFRSVACGGARLVQFGYEAMQDRTKLIPHSALQMQLAVNILTRPEDAALRLLEMGS